MAPPKENALEPTLAQFEAYDGGIMTSHRWIILPTRDIRESNKFHPVRYYVVTREEARILISHATATWLGLVKVLCPNKAPRIKRQVASVSKKAKEPSDSSNNNSLSGPAHPPKVKYQVFCQNVHTTSHRKTRKLTTSTLRAISSATKTHRTLLKPPPPRSFLGQRSTPSFTNLAQSRSAV